MTQGKWRLSIGLAAAAALVALTVACGGDSTTATKTSAPATTSAAASSSASAAATTPAAVKASGTITISATQFESWDPHFSDFAQDISHFYMVNRGLYMLDLKNIPQPELAAALPTVSADGKTYTVKLKSGVKWSDGTPMTAAQYVAGIQRTCNPDIAGHYEFILDDTVAGCAAYAKAGKATPAEKETLRAAVGVKAVDDLTLEIQLIGPKPTFTILLTMWPTFATPTQKVAKVDDKWPAPLDAPVLGPFMVKAYTEKASMELVPNPNWSGAEKPKVDKIVLRYIDDGAVAYKAYQNGELDAILLPSDLLPAVKADATQAKELDVFPATRTTGLQFNQRPGRPFTAVETRLALSQSIDRDELNTVVFKGAQFPTTLWMPPDRSGYKVDAFKAEIGFDVAKAKANLAKGSPNGLKFTLTLVDTAINKTLGAYLIDAWKKNLGIDVTLEFVDSKTRSTKYNAGEFDMTVGGWQEDYPDPENWYIGLRETTGSINKEKCGTPEIDALIAKAKTNTDDAQRRQLYKDAEKLTVTTLQCNAPLFHNAGIRMIKPYVSGMKENGRAGDTFVRGDWNPERWATTKK